MITSPKNKINKSKLITNTLLPLLLLASTSQGIQAKEHSSAADVATMATQIQSDVIKW